MLRRTIMMMLAVIVVAGGLAGCQTTDVPYDQRIVVQVVETTGQNPVQAIIRVDGQDVFGPADLAPGEPKNISIHEPAITGGPKLNPGQVYRISWRLDKKGSFGNVGDAELRVFAGTRVIATASTKYFWPNVPNNGFVDVRLSQTTTPPPGR